MNSYNGFPASQRNAAQAWLNQEWNSGRLARPTQCCSCGQRQGILHAHAEDYSLPFCAGKTDQYHLCYACHMMVHCRFGRGEAAFFRYVTLLSQGLMVKPFLTPDWQKFKIQMLGTTITRQTYQSSEGTDILARLFLRKAFAA